MTPGSSPKNASRKTCQICPAACSLLEGQTGRCRARKCVGGKVVDANYARIAAMALDPIEKKPLAMYMPGSKVLSVGGYGCNNACPFCQNADIAFAGEDSCKWRIVSPTDLLRIALDLRGRGNIGVAYTYNEPVVAYEYLMDAASLIHEAGMKNVLVSNGCINEEPLRRLLPLIDAANIDLKGFDPSFHESIGGDLETVKNTIRLMADYPECHLEVTTLVVPGLTDDAAQMEEMALWISDIDPAIPYHLTRFFPCHEMADSSPTPRDTMHEMEGIASRHLRNVFLGNM